MTDARFMKKGTGIIEIIIYAAILVVVSVFVINSLLITNTVISKIRLERRISTNADVIMQKLIREIRLAEEINASSTFDVNPSDVSLNTFLSASNTTPVVLDFYTNENNLYVKKGGESAIVLNSNNVLVPSFMLRDINASSSRAIKIELTLQASTTRHSVTANFYGMAILRGSY
ncbi:MAG: hypothetical protein A2934_01110 [Candidatus Sungbacteria bacterium RIFCSPLOWO2_01_FULL_47_10]|uniref:Uncharacterized protein n=1 Tax=Candidatus Sungbacteria bacterium RIFCSPLOWO2_01_FULL_47_10 TaxID=1802276 RepID=A0A1G2L536_9BACT|nr:MAG: hypothetical protein A2934_01110 [Candidatus Sungbacteria bacterium RIFCSPLOWO2_01_FULL_47_10]